MVHVRYREELEAIIGPFASISIAETVTPASAEPTIGWIAFNDHRTGSIRDTTSERNFGPEQLRFSLTHIVAKAGWSHH